MCEISALNHVQVGKEAFTYVFFPPNFRWMFAHIKKKFNLYDKIILASYWIACHQDYVKSFIPPLTLYFMFALCNPNATNSWHSLGLQINSLCLLFLRFGWKIHKPMYNFTASSKLSKFALK